MNQTSRYILLVDPIEEVLIFQESTLSCFYGGAVSTVFHPSEISEIIKMKGHPEMIIMDSSYITNNETRIDVPIIATAVAIDEELSCNHDSVLAVLEKPISPQELSYLVKSLIKVPWVQPVYIPVKLSALLRLYTGDFDLFLKLTENNYVKIVHKGEPFLDSDAKHLSEKGIFELYLKSEESKYFLDALERSLLSSGIELSHVKLVPENLESFEKVAKHLNWPPTVLISAQKSVTSAVKILSKNQNIISMLKKRAQEPNSQYTQHIGLLTYMVCAFSSSLGWIGGSGQVKLALAALIHDVAVDDDCYTDLKGWNKKAGDLSDKSPETIRYRMHPLEGSKVARGLDSLSSDVDQIILQHHERRDGSGFPRGLDSAHIGQLPALFIVVEDLVDFIDNGEDVETSIADFVTWGRAYYDRGHFKKIFTTFEESLRD